MSHQDLASFTTQQVPTVDSGPELYACDGANNGEAVNGQFTMQVQQTMLAALSLGPVGLADQLSARPDDASATITTNATLAMATCAADGSLLQPSYPLTPVERMLLQVSRSTLPIRKGSSGRIFATTSPGFKSDAPFTSRSVRTGVKRDASSQRRVRVLSVTRRVRVARVFLCFE